LKNPLGSIKTILQVQLENPSCRIHAWRNANGAGRISRLSTKLNQLCSQPARSARARRSSVSDSATVLREVVGVLRPEADRRGISIRLELATETIPLRSVRSLERYFFQFGCECA